MRKFAALVLILLAVMITPLPSKASCDYHRDCGIGDDRTWYEYVTCRYDPDCCAPGLPYSETCYTVQGPCRFSNLYLEVDTCDGGGWIGCQACRYD